MHLVPCTHAFNMHAICDGMETQAERYATLLPLKTRVVRERNGNFLLTATVGHIHVIDSLLLHYSNSKNPGRGNSDPGWEIPVLPTL